MKLVFATACLVMVGVSWLVGDTGSLVNWEGWVQTFLIMANIWIASSVKDGG